MRSATCEHVVQVVRDHQHREAAVGEPAHEVEHHAGLGHAERGGGLVHDHELEFHITALAIATAWRWPPDSEATGWRIERTVVTERLGQRLGAPQLHRPPRRAEPWRVTLAPEEHVLDDVEVVAQREVLVHGLDAERGGVLGRADVHRAALPEDLAAVGRVDPGDAS